MPPKRKTTKKRAPRKPDEKDDKVRAFLTLRPRAKLREISEATGFSITTVWEIIHSWPDQEWFQRATVEFENMVGGVLANYQKRVASGDGTAAHDLAFGLGLLKNREQRDNTHRNIVSSPEEIVGAIRALGTRDQDRLRELLSSDSGSTEGPPSTDA